MRTQEVCDRKTDPSYCLHLIWSHSTTTCSREKKTVLTTDTLWHVGAILKDDGNSRWFETGLTLSKEYWIIDLTCFNKRTTRPSGLSVAVDAVCISCPFGNLVLELFVVIRHVPLQRSTDSSSSTPVYQSFNWIGRGNSQWWVLWWNLGILADMW